MKNKLSEWFNINLVQEFPSLGLAELPVDFEEDVSECCGAEILDNHACANCGEIVLA